MLKRLILIVAIILIPLALNASAQGVGRSHLLTFEGTLITYSPHSGIYCGGLYVHQVAKYRVERIVAGKYTANEIIVDHPACDEDVFKNLPVGTRVRITVRVWRKYLVITMYPAIRDDEHPKIFYVAESAPVKLSN